MSAAVRSANARATRIATPGEARGLPRRTPLAGRVGEDPGQNGSSDEPADVTLPGDAVAEEGQRGIDADPDHELTDIGARPCRRPPGARPSGRRSRPRPRAGGELADSASTPPPSRRARRAGTSAVKRSRPSTSSSCGPEDPQREHVEADVEHLDVGEHRGERLPPGTGAQPGQPDAVPSSAPERATRRYAWLLTAHAPVGSERQAVHPDAAVASRSRGSAAQTAALIAIRIFETRPKLPLPGFSPPYGVRACRVVL